MIRPTRRGVLLFACGLPLALIAIAADAELWRPGLYLSLLAILAIGVDAALALPPGALTPKVTIPGTLYIGERGEAGVEFPPARYSRSATVEALLEQRGHAERQTVSRLTLAPKTGLQAAFPIVPFRRGMLEIDRIWLRWQGPLGLAQLIKTVPVKKTIAIVPNIKGVQKAELRFFPHDAIIGEKLHQHGDGTEFEALREYQTGMDIRFLDWKHSARHRKLLCKEFRTERNHPVILAFDTGHLMTDPLAGMPRLDHAINAGLRLAWLSMRSGDLAGVYGFDSRIRHYTHPLRGTHHFGRVQRAAAELDYHTEETNFTLGLAELNARLGRRALVILFTDFIDTTTAELMIESVNRTANRHVVVFVTFRDNYLLETAEHVPATLGDVTKAVIAQNFLNERTIVLERLARIGVHCLDVPSSALPVTLINRYLEIKRRGLL